jgi:glycosyltransferase involved in cell wall biosynthesis
MAEEYFTKITDVHLPSGDYVLIVPGWYPTWQDQYTGDFNQRHVKAAGITMAQVVLYIVKDITGLLLETETRFVQLTPNIIEVIVIYPTVKNGVIDAVVSNLTYVRWLYKYAAKIRRQFGKPVLLHAYIVIRGGLGGLLLAKKWGLPFILSENWTTYYPEDPGYLVDRNIVFKTVVKKIFKEVHRFLPVSKNLQQQVEKLLQPVSSTIIPNVVDTGTFYYDKALQKSPDFRFIHVSAMTYQKNPEGLLRSFKTFHTSNPGTCLWMVGPYPIDVLQYARTLGLDETAVYFTGAISYDDVASLLRSSHALVLFSRYENLPCVILESLCCGVPVISTTVGGVAEVVNTENGILLANEDEEQLTNALTKMCDNYNRFSLENISIKATRLYNYNTVGQAINIVYKEILKKRPKA